MQISEFARQAGVSARALRHYEDQGLLCPDRDVNGYRQYGEADLLTVARIRIMLGAGLSTATMRQYLDCVLAGHDGLGVEMCPGLRNELESVHSRLNREEARFVSTRAALSALSDA